MASDANDAKLLHAKMLLNKFHSRQKPTTDVFPHATESAEPNFGSSMASAEILNASHPPSTGAPSVEQSLHSSRSSSFVNIDHSGAPFDPNSQNEVAQLRQQVTERDQQLYEYQSKLQILQGHYQRLNEAYNEALRCPSRSDGSSTPDVAQSVAEMANLRQRLLEKEQQLSENSIKLQSLHGHYAELHKAYTELGSKQTEGPAELVQQIAQLRTALAVAVNDKTAQQSEIRRQAQKMKQMENDLAAIQASAHSTHSDFQYNILQSEAESLRTKILEQSSVIAQQRKECSALEAKIVVANQDKNDVQARLKYVHQEKEELNAHLQQIRNDLNMKEIYIRQLRKHSTADESPASTESQETVQKLNGENLLSLHDDLEQKTFFEAECQRRAEEIVRMKMEFEAERQNHVACLTDIRNRAESLEQNVTELLQQKRELEFSRTCLDEELQMLRKAADARFAESGVNSTITSDTLSADAASSSSTENWRLEYEALQNSYERLEADFQHQTALIGQLNSALHEKDSTLTKLNEAMLDATIKIQRLEEQLETARNLGRDAADLSERLQNEKATVSRAVAQNLELKEQFGEMQDKLIRVTNDYAAAEDGRQGALQLVEKQNQQIKELMSQIQQVAQNQVQNLERQSHAQVDASLPIVEVAEEAAPIPMQSPIAQMSGVVSVDVPPSSPPVMNQETPSPSPQIADAPVPDHANDRHEDAVPQINKVNDDQQDATLPSAHPQPSTSANQGSSDANESYSSSTTASSNHSDSSQSSVAEDINFQSELRQFLQHPHPNEPNFTKRLREFIHELRHKNACLNEHTHELERELEAQRHANDKLQYWLTAVESENESIGDYIELYRSQRAQIQAKIADKEAECREMKTERDALQCKILQLRDSIVGFLRRHEARGEEVFNSNTDSRPGSTSPPISPNIPNSTGEPFSATISADSSNCAVHSLVKMISELDSNDVNNLSALLSRFDTNPSLFIHCAECRGQLRVL